MNFFIIILVLLGALPNTPLTHEEKITKACHEYCDGVEQRIKDNLNNGRDLRHPKIRR